MGGIGGFDMLVLSMPLLRLAPSGRSTVVTEEVLLIKVGSEMSCLLTERLRADADRGAGGYADPVIMVGVGAMGDMARSGGVACAVYGAMGEARGVWPTAEGWLL